MVTPLERLRSLRHRFWFGVSESIGWTRGLHQEAPAGTRWRPTAALTGQIDDLQARYGVEFERSLSAATSVNNYEYLEVLDRAFAQLGLARPRGGVLCDVGCASFWYAAALHAFFQPQRMTGIDIEGHRLLRDGRSRVDYARGYACALPGTEFVVGDYAALEQPADVITAWYPFLTATAVLAWRLPLSVLKPRQLFARVKHNLLPHGLFVMVNHGIAEAALAEKYCTAAGLRMLGRVTEGGKLSDYRHRPPVLSCWRHE
jgi:hypothetical protein